ncbi:hypothetical protein [Pelomonas sp. Root1444]|uniref:hypothetical protein n=1 Tax=Pelomonas sp. Root1444 TaxID=1736464 RepID=UPI0012FC50D2|nr:hypothetical protein [Pelomonas sp. Root1444]
MAQSARRISRLYHGTTAPQLERFQLGMSGYGEEKKPVNGIWLATRQQGAQWHATAVAGRIHGRDAFVYECRLDPDCVLADTRRDRLPPRAFAALVQTHMHWHRRLAYRLGGWFRQKLTPSSAWFFHVDTAARRLMKKQKLSSVIDARIEIYKSIGINAVLNPLAEIYSEDRLAYYDEGVYGTVVLLLDPSKTTIVSCQHV